MDQLAYQAIKSNIGVTNTYLPTLKWMAAAWW